MFSGYSYNPTLKDGSKAHDFVHPSDEEKREYEQMLAELKSLESEFIKMVDDVVAKQRAKSTESGGQGNTR